jgi:hypothetical protein
VKLLVVLKNAAPLPRSEDASLLHPFFIIHLINCPAKECRMWDTRLHLVMSKWRPHSAV